MPPEEMHETELTPELLEEAKNLGWVPKEEFKGNKDKWVDAEEFLETGRKITPILRANNRRLQSDLLQTKNELGTLKAELGNAQTAIAALVKQNTIATRQAAEAAKASLKARIKEAREENDVDAEEELREQLNEVNLALKEEPQKPAAKPAEEPKVGASPEFLEWQKENPWYGGSSPEDKKKTKLAARAAEDLIDEGFTEKGRAFLDAVKARVEEQESPPPRNSKVEGSNPGARSRGGKGWADLPQAAKDAALQFEGTLVGPNKAYKTLDEWKKQYATDYFNEEG